MSTENNEFVETMTCLKNTYSCVDPVLRKKSEQRLKELGISYLTKQLIFTHTFSTYLLGYKMIISFQVI